MNKLILSLISLLTIITSITNAAEQVAIGKHKYLSVTHSRSLDIIAPKFAEAQALRNAVDEMIEICQGENFSAEKFNFRHDHLSTFPYSIATAEVEFKCL